jgi:hypothetical protein
VVRRCPHAIDVGELVQALWEAPHTLRHVIVVVWIVIDASRDKDGPLDTALVHFEEQLLDNRPGLRIRHRRLVRPVSPRMTV